MTKKRLNTNFWSAFPEANLREQAALYGISGDSLNNIIKQLARLGKSKKPCGKGEERNPESGRCRRVCPGARLASGRCAGQQRSKKEKTCGKGQEVSHRTGKCIKQCVPGMVRDLETMRCGASTPSSRRLIRHRREHQYYPAVGPNTSAGALFTNDRMGQRLPEILRKQQRAAVDLDIDALLASVGTATKWNMPYKAKAKATKKKASGGTKASPRRTRSRK